jgi:3-hydroxybutyryl-CoA dehydrogenase
VVIKLIGIVGAGTMGNGIAQVAAVGGFAVLMRDTSNALVDKGIANVRRNLERMLAKEKITAAGKETILSRIKGVTALEELAAADLVIEAVTERMDVKLEVFKGLNTICRPETILASNTSSLSLTQLATASGRPDKVVGMHFFNPVPVMRLVEIIRALQTSDDTFQSVRKLTEDLGKEPVSVKDSPGFVVNRMLVPMINEAVFTLYEGIATADEIDAAMKLGANHPIGPLALADMIGIDVCLFVMEILHREFGDSKYRPCPLLKQMVHAGFLGRKSGRGFFAYS